MKVRVCPSDQAGCGKYRMIWPGQALQAEGYDIQIERRPLIKVNDAEELPRVVDVQTEGADVMVFQRPCTYQITQLIPILQDRGVKVVIDMDDDLSCIHPTNPAYKAYNPKLNKRSNWDWAAKACELADLITVTTDKLAEVYGSHGRVQIIPNYVPSRFLSIEEERDEALTIGWAGWVPTHPRDLEVAARAVYRAMKGTSARFKAIGDKDTLQKLEIRPQGGQHYWIPRVEIDQYPHELAKLHIGLVPLQESDFNQAKSWLKALEYSSLGVVPVVTPTPDNQKLAALGGAYVATTNADWEEILRHLINNPDEVADMAKRCREVASDLTIEGNTRQWKDAWLS